MDVHTRRCVSNRQREALSHTAWRRRAHWAKRVFLVETAPLQPTHRPLRLPPSGSRRRIPSGSYVDALHKHGLTYPTSPRRISQKEKKKKNCFHNADVSLFVCRLLVCFPFSSLSLFFFFNSLRAFMRKLAGPGPLLAPLHL